MNQRDIQTWNDAVRACQASAMAQVHAIEAKAADGMPSAARTLVRAISGHHRAGDVRQLIDGIDTSQFPLETEKC